MYIITLVILRRKLQSPSKNLSWQNDDFFYYGVALELLLC